MTLWETITAAVRDLSEHGYDSAERVNRWVAMLHEAAKAELMSEAQLEQLLRQHLGAIYRQQVDQGGIARFHPGVARYNIEKVRPELRAELDRRMVAAHNLIKDDRVAAIERMERRFRGWATSIPNGGSDAVDKVQEKVLIRKSVTSLPFQQRRVLIDQAHKFTAALSETVAVGNDALAAVWHSRWRQPGYQYREDHKERDLRVYAVRGSWAIVQGLMNKGAGYTDEMTRAGEEVFCRCTQQWVYNLRDLPREMLTNKGQELLARTRVS